MADMHIPISLGTQTTGSTIRPSSFNGICAMKPTWNAVSSEGQKRICPTLDTLGIMARSVQDLQLVAEVIGLQEEEPAKEIVLSECHFAIVRTSVWPKAGSGTVAALSRAAKLLTEAGAKVTDVALPPEFDALPAAAATVESAEGSATFLREYTCSREQISDDLAGIIEGGMGIPRQDLAKACDTAAALRPKIDEIARQYTAIVTPSAVDEAPPDPGWTGSDAFNIMWTVCLSYPFRSFPLALFS